MQQPNESRFKRLLGGTTATQACIAPTLLGVQEHITRQLGD